MFIRVGSCEYERSCTARNQQLGLTIVLPTVSNHEVLVDNKGFSSNMRDYLKVILGMSKG